MSTCDNCGGENRIVYVYCDHARMGICRDCLFNYIHDGVSVSTGGVHECAGCGETSDEVYCYDCGRDQWPTECESCSRTAVLCDFHAECSECSQRATKCNDCGSTSATECEGCSDEAVLCRDCASMSCEECGEPLDRTSLCSSCADVFDCAICGNETDRRKGMCPSCKTKTKVADEVIVSFDPNQSYRIHYKEEI